MAKVRVPIDVSQLVLSRTRWFEAVEHGWKRGFFHDWAFQARNQQIERYLEAVYAKEFVKATQRIKKGRRNRKR